MSRQTLYYDADNKHILLDTDEKANTHLGIQWLETFGSFDTSPLPSLLIKPMSSTLGRGVFALESITENKLICLYTGEYYEQIKSDSRNHEYCLIIKQSCGDKKIFGVDAEKKGNVGRMIQYFPNKEIKNYQFYHTKKTIMDANARIGFICIDGCFYPAIYALRLIKKGEQIGCSYGKKYWDSHFKTPDIFNAKDLSIINHADYYIEHKLDKFDFI